MATYTVNAGTIVSAAVYLNGISQSFTVPSNSYAILTAGATVTDGGIVISGNAWVLTTPITITLGPGQTISTNNLGALVVGVVLTNA
jgi:hypothetical protein